MSAWLGIDLGTTGARSIVYNERFETLGAAYREYPTHYGEGGVAEQDAEAWWTLTARVVREALAASGAGADAVEGLAVSSQGITVVPVSAAYEPLGPAITWLDTRAEAELAEICENYPPETLYKMTGKRASAAYTLPKLLWLRRHRPEVFGQAAWLLLPQDFLVAKMTGRAVTDHTLASGTMLYGLEKMDWSAPLCQSCGLDPARLPALQWAGQAVGPLLPHAAQALGLRAGTMVAVGAQDQKCAALAAGLTPGMATVSLGTAAAVEALGQPDAAGRIPCFSYMAPGQRVLEGVVNTAGLNLRWLRDNLLRGVDYAEMDTLAEAHIGKGRALFLPFLSGEGSPGWGADKLGALQRLSLHTTVGEIACAVMEGVAFELLRNLRAMDLAENVPLRIFGGGAKSRVWCRIIANATGRAVHTMTDPEMACLGAALLAAQGAGARAAGQPTPAGMAGLFSPEPEHAAHYRRLFEDYLHACSLYTIEEDR